MPARHLRVTALELPDTQDTQGGTMLHRFNVTVSLRRRGHEPIDHTFKGIFAESSTKARRFALIQAYQQEGIFGVGRVAPQAQVFATDCVSTDPVLAF